MARFVSGQPRPTSIGTTKKSPKIKCEYAVTFEFPIRLPVTIRGEVEASSPQALAIKAVRDAKSKTRTPEFKAKNKGVSNWSSLVVLLDRFKFMKVTADETVQGQTDSKV